MVQRIARMTAGPLVRRQLAMRDGPTAGKVSVTADALGPSVRPAAAQLGVGADAAPPGIAVQRSDRKISKEDLEALMQSKTHDPHGGSADSNTHAAAKGYGQGKAARRLEQMMANSQAKATAAAPAPAPAATGGKGKGKPRKPRKK